jgi:hypothetical protein
MENQPGRGAKNPRRRRRRFVPGRPSTNGHSRSRTVCRSGEKRSDGGMDRFFTWTKVWGRPPAAGKRSRMTDVGRFGKDRS